MTSQSMTRQNTFRHRSIPTISLIHSLGWRVDENQYVIDECGEYVLDEDENRIKPREINRFITEDKTVKPRRQ